MIELNKTVWQELADGDALQLESEGALHLRCGVPAVIKIEKMTSVGGIYFFTTLLDLWHSLLNPIFPFKKKKNPILLTSKSAGGCWHRWQILFDLGEKCHRLLLERSQI